MHKPSIEYVDLAVSTFTAAREGLISIGSSGSNVPDTYANPPMLIFGTENQPEILVVAEVVNPDALEPIVKGILLACGYEYFAVVMDGFQTTQPNNPITGEPWSHEPGKAMADFVIDFPDRWGIGKDVVECVTILAGSRTGEKFGIEFVPYEFDGSKFTWGEPLDRSDDKIDMGGYYYEVYKELTEGLGDAFESVVSTMPEELQKVAHETPIEKFWEIARTTALRKLEESGFLVYEITPV